MSDVKEQVEPEATMSGGKPPERQDPPAMGLVGWLRWAWRQLTSMKTALILLFLLALGAVPGSLIPQIPVDPIKVSDFYDANPGWRPGTTSSGSSTSTSRSGSPRSTCCCSSR